MAGEAPLVMATAWGFVEGQRDFLTVLGLWEVLTMDGQGFNRTLVSVCQLLATYALTELVGMVSMNQVEAKSFREVTVLRLIGYTTRQSSSGLCKRGYGDHQPMHASTLANAIARLNERELDRPVGQSYHKLGYVVRHLSSQGANTGSRKYRCA